MITENTPTSFGGKYVVIWAPVGGCMVSTAKEGFFKKQSMQFYKIEENARRPLLLAKMRFIDGLPSKNRLELHDMIVSDIDQRMSAGTYISYAILEVLTAVNEQGIGDFEMIAPSFKFT